uniref:Hexosyltransferase n=1 Tax=Sus scrofa TaxID=9823 RepID=A0A287BQL8_PIG
MAYVKMRWVYVSLVVVGALCLYFSLDSLSPSQGEPLAFKKKNEDFLQLPDIDCRQDPPFLVLLVTSSHEQLLARKAIRQTWGKASTVQGKRIRSFFLLGTTNSGDLSRAVAQEIEQYHDIIQKDFLDVYFNLTLKTMMGMEWVSRFCPQATFVMKTGLRHVCQYLLSDGPAPGQEPNDAVFHGLPEAERVSHQEEVQQVVCQ